MEDGTMKILGGHSNYQVVPMQKEVKETKKKMTEAVRE